MADKKPISKEQKEEKLPFFPDEKVIKEKEAQSDVITSAKEVPKKDKDLTVEMPVTFDRWFQARRKEKGYKIHWVDGMRAFTDTNQKRTMSDWDAVFSAY